MPIHFNSKSKEWCWLSNFFLSPTTIQGKEYLTVEHWFQSQKFTNSELQEKSQEIAGRYTDAIGFIGISRSPTCGIAAGVKDYGKTIKAPMHQAVDCPSTEISSMNTESNRQKFLERIKKYESRRSC